MKKFHLSKKKYKVTANAPVTLGFTGACLAVTLLGSLTGRASTYLLFMTYHSSWMNPLTYVRLFTHVLGHSGMSHFINNAMFLLLLGPMLEEKYGKQTLLRVIVATALVTGLVHNILFYNAALCGASGVVFAFILLASFTKFHEGEIPLTVILVAIIYIGQQIVEGMTVSDNISNLTHILGGLVGAFVGYALNRSE